MKWVFIKRLKVHIDVHPQKFAFAQDKSTADGIHIARELQETFMQNKTKQFPILVDLEKAFDKVSRQAIEYRVGSQTAASIRVAGTRNNELVSPFLIPGSFCRSTVRQFFNRCLRSSRVSAEHPLVQAGYSGSHKALWTR